VCKSGLKCIQNYKREGGAVFDILNSAEYRLVYSALLQKRPIILSILPTEATPYSVCCRIGYTQAHKKDENIGRINHSKMKGADVAVCACVCKRVCGGNGGAWVGVGEYGCIRNLVQFFV